MSSIRLSYECTNHIQADMSYKAYYADKTIPKQHNFGLGSPKQFAGGLRLSTEHFFRRMKKEGKIPPKMKYEEWSKIINLTNQKLMDTVLTTEMGIRLPSGLGYIRIEGRKPPEDKPIYVFKGVHERVKTYNMHSFGYVYSMKWIKDNKVRLRLKDIYHFATTREIKRTMCIMIENEFPYIKNKNYEFCK